METQPMKPVKVRYFGVLPLTRKAYWRILFWVCVATTILVILVLTLTSRPVPPFHWPWETPSPTLKSTADLLYYHYGYTLVAACIIAQIIDAAVMMKKFAAKEQERRDNVLLKDGLDD